MSILNRIFRRGQDRTPLLPLYNAAVAAARQPGWYIDGKVADTLDGRFDMVAAMLSIVLLRLEADGDRHAAESALLTEIFVEDMDGQLREIGIGDVIVGKHIGRMVSALGGRLGAYRNAFAGEETLEDALERNLYRGEKPADEALAWAAARMRTVHAAVMAASSEALLAGQWPTA